MCAQVNLLEAMGNMDQATFEFRFGEELVYTTLLSDGQMVELIPGGSNVAVRYEDRGDFIRLVQKVRLEESKQQVGLQRCWNFLSAVRLIVNSSTDYSVYVCVADRSHAGGDAEGGSSGRAGPAHLAGSGEESVRRP